MSKSKADEIVEKIETLRGAEAPNQMALELLKASEGISELVVIIRDMDGKLQVTWTDQDLACVAEAALTLTAQVQHDCFHTHLAPDPGEGCDVA